MLSFKESFPYIDSTLITSGLPQWLWQWGNFDGVHYLNIAKNGYDGFGLQVFFPFYPSLIKLLFFLTGSHLISALLISHLAFLIASIVFGLLVEREFDKNTAKWAVLFLFSFPTSFFFGSVYTESLFLMLIVLSFYSKGIISGIVSSLASATRLAGIFMLPALFVHGQKKIYSLFSPIGFLIYAGFLTIKFNNPFYFLSAQSAFKNARADSFSSLVTPPQVVFRYFKIFTTADFSRYDFWVAVSEFIFFIFGAGLLSYLTIRRKVSPSYLLFSWPALILPVFSGTFQSMPRYLLTIFPIYIALGMIENKWVKIIILAIFFIFLSIFTILFTRGYFIA